MSAAEAKQEGNAAVAAGDYKKATECYSRAIELDGENAVYYCNRAIAYTRMGMYSSAVSDAEDAISIDPRNFKAYSIGGAACLLNGRRQDAIALFKRGLALDPSNENLKTRLRQAEAAPAAASRPYPRPGGAGAGGMLAPTGAVPGSAPEPAAGATFQQYVTASRDHTLYAVQSALRAYMLLQAVLYIVSGTAAFPRFMYATMATNVLALYRQHGTPRFDMDYGRRVVLDPALQALFLSFLFLSGFPSAIAMLLFLPVELAHLAHFTHAALSVAAPAAAATAARSAEGMVASVIGHPSFASLSKTAKWSAVNRATSSLVAQLEVGTGIKFIVELLLPTRNILALVMFWQYLRMRAMLNQDTKDAFAALDARILGITQSPNCPPMIRTGYSKLREFMQSSARLPASREEANNQSFLQRCSIM